MLRRAQHYFPMINQELDLTQGRLELSRRTRVQIRDWLEPEAAQALRHCLQEQVPWDLAHYTAQGAQTVSRDSLDAMSADQQAQLLQQAHQLACTNYAFAYDSYQMVTAYKAGRSPGLLLHRVLEFLNSPEYLQFARELTLEPLIRRTSAQATRYRQGQFLKHHTDNDVIEGRLFAYVINLSQHWEADWGGLLQFIDDTGAVTQTLLPHFNSLSIFRVPQGHAVSLVAPWAREHRLAITGWFMA